MNSNSKQTDSLSEQPAYPWSATLRSAVSFALVVYLFIVIAAPAASHPDTQSELTRPVAETLRPIHESLYLGHGYRFFAPNPGPSHIVQYSLHSEDGTKTEGRFPDRDQHWPRLLYHRWFMLSESLYSDAQLVLDEQLFEQGQREVQNRITQLKQAGKYQLAKQLQAETDLEVAAQQETQKRIELLTNAIGQHLLETYGAQQVQLTLHERAIPFPKEFAQGTTLDDPQQLSTALRTWVVTSNKSGTEAAQNEVPQP